jgi:lipid-binding SYLF domain-containing protein
LGWKDSAISSVIPGRGASGVCREQDRADGPSHPQWSAPTMRPPARWLAPALTLAAAFGAAGPAGAQVRETQVVDRSTAVLVELSRIPEGGIPPSLLRSAEGIAIIPGMIKAGFLASARFGRGVVLVKSKQQVWSEPVFVTLAGGGFGFQVGAQATDLILVFTNRRAIDGFLVGRGKFTLGADASVAAGPLGRQVGAGTDVRLQSEILTYSRSRGLFAGVSLEGASLSLDWKANVAYYGDVASPGEVLAGRVKAEPPSAAKLRGWLTYFSGTPAAGTPTAPADPNAPPPPPEGLDVLPPEAPPAAGDALPPEAPPASTVTGPPVATSATVPSRRLRGWRRAGTAPAPAAAIVEPPLAPEAAGPR